LQTSTCQWATALCIQVMIVHFSAPPRDASERGHYGGNFFPCSFKREATGAELTFNHSITRNFMVNKI